jgi:nickel transport protein
MTGWRLGARGLLLVCALSAADAAAHDLWLEPAEAGFVLLYGHRTAAHDGEALIDYDPAIVRAVECFDLAGARRHVEATRERPVRILGDCAAVHVLTSSGFWTRTTEGLRNRPADELSGVLRSWESIESVKRLEAWSAALAKPLTAAMEITPLHDPFAVAPGGKLRLLVTLDGAPRPGAAVAYDGETRGVTDAAGRVNLRVRAGGTQFITASFEAPRTDRRAERTLHATTLLLQLPQ